MMDEIAEDRTGPVAPDDCPEQDEREGNERPEEEHNQDRPCGETGAEARMSEGEWGGVGAGEQQRSDRVSV